MDCLLLVMLCILVRFPLYRITKDTRERQQSDNQDRQAIQEDNPTGSRQQLLY